jgi:hypothetical protein
VVGGSHGTGPVRLEDKKAKGNLAFLPSPDISFIFCKIRNPNQANSVRTQEQTAVSF